MNEPLVSIIIAAKNAQNTLEKCIASVLALDYPHVEIIVVDDGSKDATASILKRFEPRIKVLTHPDSKGPSLSRNAGASIAQGIFVAFTDADCVVERDWLTQLLKGFTDETIASVGGSQRVATDESALGKIIYKFTDTIHFTSEYVRKAEELTVAVIHNPSCNVMYRRDVFLEEKGYLVGLWPGEDVELDYRLRKKKFKLLFNSKAIVFHYRTTSVHNFLKMMYRYAWSSGFLIRRYGFFRKVHYYSIACLFLSLLFLISVLSSYCFFSFLIVTAALLILFKFDVRLVVLSVGVINFWNMGFLRGFVCYPYSYTNAKIATTR